MTLISSPELETHELFEALGLEPLSAEFDVAALARVLEGVRAPLKSALLDQRRIAGLGNIYVCEALHRAKLSPLREAGSVPRAKMKALYAAIRTVLEEAIEAGGSTLRDHRQADGELGYFQHAFAVYDREGVACRHKGCVGSVARVAQGGRSTFYCPQCQR
jgi:formamidopyrimidine-DNA glycosylase